MSRDKSFRRIAKRIEGRLVDIRRDFHMYPETAFKETRTSRKVADVLRGLGIEVRYPVGRTGVVGLLRGASRGGTVALRADMDALPVQEANEVPYRSRNDGVMHACGHDAHTTMLLGAAMILSECRDKIPGRVKFIFQPAEETVGGAKAMIRDGALENPRVDAIFAIHVKAETACGAVGLRSGPVLAAVDHLKIVIEGRGGHGGYPHETRDPLVAANEIYQAFQTIRRNVNAFDPFVLSVCSVHGGTAFNIIPQEVVMEGTLRTYSEDARKRIKDRMRSIVRGISEAIGVESRLMFVKSCPGVVNDEAAIELTRRTAEEIGLPVTEEEPVMGGEDFAFYLAHVPGAFIRIGARKGGKVRTLHSNRFDLDEKVLPLGSELLARCAWRQLAGK